MMSPGTTDVAHPARGAATTRATEPALANRTIHFVGIGGCGLSGLAQMLAEQGATCTGSDGVPTELTAALQAEGIPISVEESAESLPANCDLLIASAAISPDHPQRLAAHLIRKEKNDIRAPCLGMRAGRQRGEQNPGAT